MNEDEIFVDIEGYEGKYQVSNLGRIKSLGNENTKKEKILKQIKDRGGYLCVNLCKNGKGNFCLVHRLVANAFIENPSNLPQVNHKDENKTNNIVDNLEWCDAKYNTNYGTAIQRRVASTDYKTFQQKRVTSTDWKSIGRKTAEKLSKQVYQYSLDGELVAIWKSTTECGRNGFNFRHVSDCCLSKRKSHKGFIWSYVELKK